MLRTKDKILQFGKCLSRFLYLNQLNMPVLERSIEAFIITVTYSKVHKALYTRVVH